MTTGLELNQTVVFGFIDGARAQEDFTSDATWNYTSYITNHLAPVLSTERILRGR